MNEIERNILPKEFGDYLVEVQAWIHNEQVADFLRKARTLLPHKDVRDIFISSCQQDDQTILKDLWIFSEGYCVKAKFLEAEKQREIMELTPLKGEAKCVHFAKQNYRFHTESRRRTGTEARLEISIKLENDQTLDFEAVGAENCKHLLGIYWKYLAPLFPV